MATGWLLAVSCLGGCSSCSSSAPGSSAGESSPAAQQVAALTAIAENNPAAGVPVDTPTARAAAQLYRLQLDTAVALGTAAMLQASEGDASNGAQIEAYRQEELALAASNTQAMQALLGATTLPSSALLASDGGPARVLEAILWSYYVPRARALLDRIDAGGSAAPSEDEVAAFLQQVALVMSDDGAEGHDVAAQTIAAILLADGSVEGITALDGGLP